MLARQRQRSTANARQGEGSFRLAQIKIDVVAHDVDVVKYAILFFWFKGLYMDMQFRNSPNST